MKKTITHHKTIIFLTLVLEFISQLNEIKID